MAHEFFPNIFTPLRLGPITLKNRIFISSHNNGMALNDMIDDRMIAYYRRRAQAGVALIVTGATAVHRTSYSGNGRAILNQDDSIIPWLKKTADALHEYDCKFFMQLIHHGRQGDPHRFELPLWGASDRLIDEHGAETVHVLEQEEIQEVVRAFADAAARCRAGGVDGVEIAGANTNLIVEFLSPRTNNRTDEYGGNEENRLRFPREVLGAVRKAVGDDFVLGMKVQGDELVEGGLTTEDSLRIIPKLVEYGKLDYVLPMDGSQTSYYGHALMVPPYLVPPSFNVPLAAAVKQVVNVPVFALGRIAEPSTVEQILDNHEADMVGMTRAHIADPDIVKKAFEGRADEIRTCVGYNDGCIGRRHHGHFISCVQNPETGREIDWAPLEDTKTRQKKRLMVVGGGPAGMEAARVAAIRGHDVALYERSDSLGGQLKIQARAPRRDEVEVMITNWQRAVDRAGVKVKLNTEVTPQLIEAENPDVVIVATGADARRLTPAEIPGIDAPNVVTGWDVLTGKVETGQRVVVLDADRGQQGLNVADYLAVRGKDVELVTQDWQAGLNVEKFTRWMLLQR